VSHWITNRGKLLLMQGNWDDVGATAIDIGLLVGASTPAAIDTEAEIQDLSTVAALLALTGVDEPVGGWYTRKDLTRSVVTQDDTDNRAEADASNVTWTAATAGETIYGAFVYDATTDTNDTTRQLMSLILFTPVPLNGSDFTLTITDLYRGT
jgi:hypothetical protein